MKWAVEIQHTTLPRRNLADLLAGLGFTLTDGMQNPAFTSAEIDQCNTATEAFDIAKKLRTALTGPAEIDKDFVLGPVIDFTHSPPTRHTFLEVHSAVHRVTTSSVTLRINPPADLSAEALEIWEASRAEQQYQTKLDAQRNRFEPAYLEPRAARVLQYLAESEPSAEVLYKVYELVEEHPSKRAAFHAQFSISADTFNRFRDSVHNPAVNGDWARHAYPDKPRTTNPMDKKEAEEFVRGLAQRWLENIRSGQPP